MKLMNIVATAVVAAAGLLYAATSAVADEKEYAKLGRWTITAVTKGNTFGYCAADTDNGLVQLRIATNGKEWQLGNPYYGPKGAARGAWGIDGAMENVYFVHEGDSYASTDIPRRMLADLRKAKMFAIDLVRQDKGSWPSLQKWTMTGVAAAMDAAMECARNRGVRQPAAVIGRNCPAPGAVRARESSAAVKITVFNGINVPLEIVWIGYDGSRKSYARLAPNSTVELETFATHPWIAVDPKGDCRGGVFFPAVSNDPAKKTFRIVQ